MALDPYSLCPGGREKKIRFCCPDMVKEIDQIERLLESNQGAACLSFIQTLEKDHNDCACLTAAKLSVYRTENRWDDAIELAQSFYEKEPENPIATSEYALALAVTGRDPRKVISILIDGFERAPKGVAHNSLINVTLQVGTCFLVQGLVMPVIAIGNQLKRFPTAQDHANALLLRASSMVVFPIMFRDMMFEHQCPDHFPERTKFEDAIELISQMRWKEGLALLESLTQYASVWSAIWRNVAAVRFWLLDNENGCKALQIFAAQPNTTLEDAADAEATRLFMTKDPLGDHIELLYLEYSVQNPEAILEKLLSSPLFRPIPPTWLADKNAPPPQSGFFLLNRPLLPAGTDLNLDNVSSHIANVLLFGKETNRAARLVIPDISPDNRRLAEQILNETLGDLLRTIPIVRPCQTVSRSAMLLHQKFIYDPKTYHDTELLEKLEKNYYETVFTENWCHFPLARLDNKTPSEAANDPAYRIRLLGMIQVLEFWVGGNLATWFANYLRAKLGLPIHEAIVIPAGSDEEMLENLEDHPVWRWHRFEVEKLPTNFLSEGLPIVVAMKESGASQKFARELLNRPVNAMSHQIRSIAFETLIVLAKDSNRVEEALNWIEKGKKEAAENHLPDAGLLLHEIPIRLILGQYDKADEVIGTVSTKYGRNENVMQALQNIFIQLGMMNPDGTPTTWLQELQSENVTIKPDGIWTPETITKNNRTSKLWTPE
ncbi:MAG: hypothetical protein LBQ50_00375 [Planctomycetaceae bacterium]|jgi:hypothetical protein|nr:hypothetical protein [Planctomycetaceae bacterium]